MMKALLHAVVLTLLVAGCVQLPFGTQQVGSLGESIVDNPDLSIQATAYPAEIKGGRNISVSWTITNNQDSILKDINVNAYDQCLFSGESMKHFDELKPNRTQTWVWSWSSEPTQFERDCDIKYKVTWNSSIILMQDINVLSEVEYYTRQQAGTLTDLEGSSATTDNPITFSLDFSEPLPWLNATSVYMYMKAEDTGSGMVSKLEKGNVNITMPKNLDVVCDEFEKSGDSLILARDLTFINKQLPSLTCAMNVTTDNLIETGTLSISANYKYELDDSFTVKVKIK